MNDVFETTNGSLEIYIRLPIHRNRLQCQLYLDQHLYIEQIICKFSFHNSTPTNIPTDFNIPFNAITNIVDDIEHDFPYKEMIRNLQFVNISTLFLIFHYLLMY